jgi:flagellar hook-basal body complex protein FliE
MSRIPGGNLAREAILAAQRNAQSSQSGQLDGMVRARQSVDDAFSRVQDAMEKQLGSGVGAASDGALNGSTVGTENGSSMMEAVRSVDRDVRAADPDVLAESLITGKVNDIHEVVAIVKQAEISQRFALEIRNKLIDAYREVMRMGV